jgi:hypothetical protein
MLHILFMKCIYVKYIYGNVMLQFIANGFGCEILGSQATRMKMNVFCDVAPCSLVEIFRTAYCLRHQGIMTMEGVSPS